MMDHIRLSFVIPVYNAWPYLEPCLRSLEEQGLKEGEYEVVCVDDGSTDGSWQTLQKWEGRKKFFHALQEKHGGASCARNRGLEVAQGEYVWMVDADDLLVPRCAPRLLERMEREELDVLTLGVQDYTDEAHRGAVSNVAHKLPGVVTGRTYLLHCEVEMACWCLLFRREVAVTHGVRLMEGITLEDLEFAPHLLMYCRRVASESRVCYYYRHNMAGISKRKTPDFYSYRLACWLKVMDRLQEHERQAGCLGPVMGDKAYMLLLFLWESDLGMAEKMRYVRLMEQHGVFGLLRDRRMIYAWRHKLAALCFRRVWPYRLFLRQPWLRPRH